ncbi:MAG: hypothetical protein OEW72_08475, partial [Gammaproteobacteria bacterium]|nr:hypothetical protein [Gammaproteobacteria bacterium]
PVLELGLGLGLLALFLIQESAGWHWPWLGRLQDGDVYMQISGFVLLALVGHQWYFSVLRAQGQPQRAARLAGAHQLLGASAPAVFYLHAERIGHAYLAALSIVFFAVLITGLMNLGTAPGRGAPARAARITLHVGLSTALLFLLGYHVFVSYAYE